GRDVLIRKGEPVAKDVPHCLGILPRISKWRARVLINADHKRVAARIQRSVDRSCAHGVVFNDQVYADFAGRKTRQAPGGRGSPTRRSDVRGSRHSDPAGTRLPTRRVAMTASAAQMRGTRSRQGGRNLKV